MSTPDLYHGGAAGLGVGDRLLPSPPHVTDGCPICVARAAGRSLTVGEYRTWLRRMGPSAVPVLEQLAGAPDHMPVDPPSAKAAVYVTASLPYANWYAARSQGDLYRVRAVGPPTPSPEDPFPSWTVPEAVVLEVVRRRVRLDRRERREILRLWKKADRARDRAAVTAEAQP